MKYQSSKSSDIRSNGVKSSTTQHQKALGWNVGLVVGLNARLTFKGVNLAGGGPHCLKVVFSHSSSRDDPDHGAAPDSAVATPYHLLSHPLSFSVRPWGTSWPTNRLAKLCSLSSCHLDALHVQTFLLVATSKESELQFERTFYDIIFVESLNNCFGFQCQVIKWCFRLHWRDDSVPLTILVGLLLCSNVCPA